MNKHSDCESQATFSMQVRLWPNITSSRLDFWVLFLAWWVSPRASEQGPLRRAELEPRPGLSCPGCFKGVRQWRGKSLTGATKTHRYFLPSRTTHRCQLWARLWGPTVGHMEDTGSLRKVRRLAGLTEEAMFKVGRARAQSTPKQEKHRASSTGSMKWWTAWHVQGKRSSLDPSKEKQQLERAQASGWVSLTCHLKGFQLRLGGNHWVLVTASYGHTCLSEGRRPQQRPGARLGCPSRLLSQGPGPEAVVGESTLRFKQEDRIAARLGSDGRQAARVA